MECFRSDGHLSDEGLQALLAGELSELERLELSEHLDFCGDCLNRYTALLCDDVLLAHETPVRPTVMRRLRRRRWRQGVGRYGAVAAAACLAVLLWGVGSFMLPRLAGGADERTLPGAPPSESQAEGWFAQWRQDLADGWQGLFGKDSGAGAAAAAAQQPEASQPQLPSAPEPQVQLDVVPDSVADADVLPQDPNRWAQNETSRSPSEREQLFDKDRPNIDDGTGASTAQQDAA